MQWTTVDKFTFEFFINFARFRSCFILTVTKYVTYVKILNRCNNLKSLANSENLKSDCTMMMMMILTFSTFWALANLLFALLKAAAITAKKLIKWNNIFLSNFRVRSKHFSWNLFDVIKALTALCTLQYKSLMRNFFYSCLL